MLYFQRLIRESQQLSLCCVVALKSLPVHWYKVFIFFFFWSFGTAGFNTFIWEQSSVQHRARQLRDVTCAIPYEQTPSNFAAPGSSVGCTSSWHAVHHGFHPQVRQNSFVEIGHEVISMADMLSGTKIAGQLRKNSSGHATQIFAKMSRKFEILAVSVKRFCKAVLVCRLHALKTSILLGTWFLYRVFPVRISQVSLRYCTVCLPIHRSEEFRKTTGVLTTLTISIVDC